jgi:hypothetical protein
MNRPRPGLLGGVRPAFTEVKENGLHPKAFLYAWITMNDLINGCIELLGALLLVGNCRLLYSHKAVQGVSVLTTAFFTLWGIWNLYFYPANNLWLSFVGGLCLASANLTWVVMAIYYSQIRTARTGPQGVGRITGRHLGLRSSTSPAAPRHSLCELWHHELVIWWQIPAISVSEMARRIGVAVRTVTLYAARHDFLFPREADQGTCAKPIAAMAAARRKGTHRGLL